MKREYEGPGCFTCQYWNRDHIQVLNPKNKGRRGNFARGTNCLNTQNKAHPKAHLLLFGPDDYCPEHTPRG